MAPDLPLMIEPAKLAVSEKRLEGQVPLSKLGRISDLILERDGAVSYSLAFARDDMGIVQISGDLTAPLTVTCQRCLGIMQLQLRCQVNVGVIDDQQQIDELPETLEPVIAEERRISLLQLLEDELLLGMPLAPVHEPSDCPATKLLGELAVSKENPFAVLKDLKKAKH